MDNKKSKIKRIKEFIYRYRAIFFIIGLAAASMLGVIHLFAISNTHSIELITKTSIKTARKAFLDLEKSTANMLSATIKALMVNDTIAVHFFTRDREALYQVCRPLFRKLKRQNRITHWYFLNPEPEKTCFLRVHSPHLYNDLITRATLDNCIITKSFTVGKELGKTALALRTVHPFYYKNQLLGYMELAVQIEDFLEILKEQTGNEYCLLIKKEYLDRKKWVSVTTVKALRNTWDDLKHLLHVYSTWECVYLDRFIKALEDIEHIPVEGIVLEKISRDNTHFVRGIFPFNDAAGRKVGGILSLKEITPMVDAMKSQKSKIILMLLGFMSLITFFMIFFHTRAEKELRQYRGRLEEMVRESTKELLEANVRLNLEIKENKEAQMALEQECEARQDAERKHVQAVKHAERSARLASIGVMAASITHEINQPLNAIKVTADSIQYWHKRNPGALPQPFTHQLDIISQSVQRIVEIIEHMRTFWVRPGSQEISDVNVNQAIKNALSLTRQQLHAHGIIEVIKMDTDPLVVKGNIVNIEQIIVNLVVNAVHALDQKRGKDKKIEISTFVDESFAVVVVRDNGPGLPTEDSNKLFDPFFSTHNNGEGMGLGLAIVKRYVDKYGGSVKAANHAEGGALFTVKFPLALTKKERRSKVEIGKEENLRIKPNENPVDR
jgi:signal transduction histidine kinase/histidinol phosphatase-like enzyme